MSRVDRANRVVATAVGLALVSGGSYGLARSAGVLGSARDPILGAEPAATLAANPGLAGGVATFVALVLAWIGWRALRSQLSPTPSLGEVRLDGGPEGSTSVLARALAEAVVRDLEAEPGISAARVRVFGRPRAPSVDLHAELVAGAELAEVRRQVDEVVIPRLRSALAAPELSVSVRYRLTPSRSLSARPHGASSSRQRTGRAAGSGRPQLQ